jgi:hypothetical protein
MKDNTIILKWGTMEKRGVWEEITDPALPGPRGQRHEFPAAEGVVDPMTVYYTGKNSLGSL